MTTIFKLPVRNTMAQTRCSETYGTLCTPNGFAMKARCERLKRMLRANQ